MNAAETTPTLIPGKNYAPARLGRVLVVGLGKSGKAAVEYCEALLGTRVESIMVSAGKRTADAEAFAASHTREGIEFRFEYEDIEGSFDVCIVSPGISDLSALFASAKRASAEMLSELEFAWRESDASARWVAISGTNGKTTTTSLVAHILVSAGMRAHAVGNIGEVALTCVRTNPQDVYVAEISSFQLACTSRFAPDVAVMLNITPDHVEWHGSFERYVQAKARLFANYDKDSRVTAIFDATNDVARDMGESFASGHPNARIIRLQTPEEMAAAAAQSLCGAAGVLDGRLVADVDGMRDLGPWDALQIKGPHNALNALAAGCAALSLGVSDADVRQSLADFAPLEHRIEPCGMFDGVSWYNDSKGTNVDSTVKAIAAFAPGSVICLLGGHDKGTDLAPLVDAARRGCKAVVCYGEARTRFLQAFGAPGLADGESCTEDGILLVAAAGMREATRAAGALALPGDVVLLSPACSSFDEFTSYGERGRVFKALVAAEFGSHER